MRYLENASVLPTVPMSQCVVGPGPMLCGGRLGNMCRAAGLSAARQLRNHGYKVVVLEGADRPGGRVHTHRLEVRPPAGACSAHSL